MERDIVYLDNNSTTRVDEKVLESMIPYFTISYGNSASRHFFGTEIKHAVEKAREEVSQLLNSNPSEIIFTSGATEAINLAFKGLVKSYISKGKHIITAVTEHPAVLDTCKVLESEGCEVTYLPVNDQGLININDLKNNLRSDTILVSIMFVNNETGVIQPIREIAKATHEAGALFMTDATQAAGKIPINVDDMGIDLLALSAHKFYGPKGIGCLYVRNRRPYRVKLSTLLHGGGHERNLRSGTLNVPGIVGFGKASVIAKNEMATNAKKIESLRNDLETGLLEIKGSQINGSLENRIYSTSNIRFHGIDADAVISSLKNIVISNGSACSSHSIKPSHVLIGMGLTEAESISSIRFSLGKFNTKEDITATLKIIVPLIKNLRKIANSV